MTKATTIDLPDHQRTYLEAKIAEGVFGSMSEAVQAALRLLEERESKLEQLRSALIEGEETPVIAFDAEEFLSKLHAESAD